MTDLEHPQQRWTEWVNDVCEALDVDADEVDIAAIHDLSKHVAHRLERPLAPVSTFILGLAIGGGSGTPQDRAAILARILDTLPPEHDTGRSDTHQHS